MRTGKELRCETSVIDAQSAGPCEQHNNSLLFYLYFKERNGRHKKLAEIGPCYGNGRMSPIRTSALLLLFAALPSGILADEAKIDLILEEVAALRQEVAQLQQRVDALETRPVAKAPPSEQNAPIDKPKRWYDNMRIELKKAEARASGPWIEAENWKLVENGMKEDDAIAILGEPTRRKFSVRKDTDEILIYEGDLNGEGELVSGEIRIYKGKIRRFVAPDFPTN